MRSGVHSLRKTTLRNILIGLLVEILAELENYRIPDDMTNLVKALRDAAFNYDYEKLCAVLAAF